MDVDTKKRAMVKILKGFEKIIKTNRDIHSLIDLNDMTKATPQQIGLYLEMVIEGGENTPFMPLDKFPEKES